MVLWIIIPIILYFFKINLSVVIGILVGFDLLRGRSLFKKYAVPNEFTTYCDENGIHRWYPEEKWFSNGIKYILQTRKASIVIDALSAIYKFFLILCYFKFEFYYFKEEIIFSSLFLIFMSYVSWTIGEIIELKAILKEEKKRKETN